MVKGGFYTTIGYGDARVWIEYQADKDYDNRGDFWDVDWETVKVFYGETDITDVLGTDAWDRINDLIKEDLP